jgi:LmbE family N-acetylglucosaminyl deacetylase
VKRLGLAAPGERLSLLCIGAHSDDIEIGVGATILDLIACGIRLEVDWVVLSAGGQRGVEARASATAILAGAARMNVELAEFRDGFFPYQGSEIKVWLEALKSRIAVPDVVFSHWRDDSHQDHREVSLLTWNTFRDHLILEYEVPKWDGDLGRPNAYMPVSQAAMSRKVDLLMEHFGTQRSKDWFDERTFNGLARLRGMECRAADGLAEAFHARKLSLG